MNIDAFKQLPVLSIESGARLGFVDDVLFDTSPLRVAALRVKQAGQQIVVPWSVVKTVGVDAIMVPDDAAAHTPSSEAGLSALRDSAALRALRVVDEGGTFIGTVKAVEVDPATGAITAVEAHTGGMLGMGGTTTAIGADEVRSIGDEVLLTTVRRSAAEHGATRRT